MTDSNPARDAQAALERGDTASLALFDRALKSDPGNASLWLGKARALELNGDTRGARIVAQQIADQAPGFLEAQALLAGLRLAAGDPDFASHYEKAAARHPQNPNIPAAHAKTLAGLDHAAEATEVAARARKRFPGEPHFALLEAVHAGAAGDWQRANTIFTSLDYDDPQRTICEARHRLRGAQPEQADELLGRAIDTDPSDIAAWALRGIAWRVLEDERAEWLHGQDGLVQFRSLDAREDLIDEVAGVLRDLHRVSAMPLGQSLRGGTQTRGILFNRPDPLLAELREAIRNAIDAYRAELPDEDPAHPLLRHRSKPWRLAGSWSVRLSGAGDHHTAHIHPEGLVSSALYLVVPAEAQASEQAGFLELGRPPPDLGLDLPPLETICPQPAHLALFPSTLYHGTTPFSADMAEERLTIAFDIAPDG